MNIAIGAAIVTVLVLMFIFARPAKGETVMPKGGILPLSVAVETIAVSMARFETGYWAAHPNGGFSLEPALWKGRARRNNSPGNLRYNNQVQATGFDDANYAIFPNAQAGWDAMLYDIRQKLIGRTRTNLGPHSTLAEFITVWAPPEDNNPTANYIAFVAREIGQDPNNVFVNWIDYEGVVLA